MRKFAAVLVFGVALAVAGPASADRSSAGCQAYGQFVASALQANVPGGALVSEIAKSGPGAEPAFAAVLKQNSCG